MTIVPVNEPPVFKYKPGPIVVESGMTTIITLPALFDADGDTV